MNILKKTKYIYRAFVKTNKRKILHNFMRTYKDSGWHGIKAAVVDKAHSPQNTIGFFASEKSISISKDKIGRNILNNQQTEYSREKIVSDILQMAYRPKFSIIVPLKSGQYPDNFYECVQNQIYPDWEIIYVCLKADRKEKCEFTTHSLADETRIKFMQLKKKMDGTTGINTVFDVISGDFIALAAPDDQITPDALYRVASEINRHLDADFIYSDECETDSSLQPAEFVFKPDWSPTLLLSCMYTGNLTIYRTKAVMDAGGFHADFFYNNDYDLALRMSEHALKILHIERILYIKSCQTQSEKKIEDIKEIVAAVDRWYRRQGLRVKYDKNMLPAKIKLDKSPLVSIVIPTDSRDNLRLCVDKIKAVSSYKNVEYVPVVNSFVAEEAGTSMKGNTLLSIVRYDKPSNFSDKCNQGARAAQGEVLIFFNDDAYPLTVDWIERLLDILYLPGVGGVSPIMFYEGAKSIQYAGTIILHPSLGLNGPAYHFRDFDDTAGNRINQKMARDGSGISGACMAVRKETFLKLGGFDAQNTPNAHSDVDFSFRLMAFGLRCACTPNSLIVHPGNGTWKEKWKKEKVDVFCIKHYRQFVERDRYFTDSMKTYEFGRDALKNKIYYPENYDGTKAYKGDILLIAHELSRTGAPIVLFDMAKYFLDDGYFVMVASSSDGPLRKEMTEAGIIVYIEESIWAAHSLLGETEEKFPGFWHFDSFICNFDLVVVNSMVCHAIINRYNGINIPIIWWLHEGDLSLENMKEFLPSKLEDNIRVKCAGKYIQKMLEQFNIRFETSILLFGINDIGQKQVGTGTGKLRFLLVGSYERRKGQDIFMSAIEEMPEVYREKAEFMFIGSKIVEQEIYDQVKDFCSRHSNAFFMSMIPREELYRIYSETLCVVAPSRDDPMPVVITEAWMFSNICICSDKTGASHYIQDGENGFVFKNEDYKELSQKMMCVIDNQHRLKSVRLQGRKIYEDHFTMDVFHQNLKKIVSEYFPSQ